MRSQSGSGRRGEKPREPNSPTRRTSALTLRLVHKGLYGANCRAHDDIATIFERHNAHCHIMKGTTHFKKLISFPFVLQSDDTNPPTMAECFAGRRAESKKRSFCEAQRAAAAEKGPRGNRSSFIERTPLRRALPSGNTGARSCVEKLARGKGSRFWSQLHTNCKDKVGDLCFALERRLLKARERSRHSAVYLPDIWQRMYRGINLILQELHKGWEIFCACGAVDQRGPLSVGFRSRYAFVVSFLFFLFIFLVKVRKFTSSRGSWHTLTAQSLPNSLAFFLLACYPMLQ